MNADQQQACNEMQKQLGPLIRRGFVVAWHMPIHIKNDLVRYEARLHRAGEDMVTIQSPPFMAPGTGEPESIPATIEASREDFP